MSSENKSSPLHDEPTPLRIDQSAELTTQLLSMKRSELIEKLLNFSAPFPVDFSPEFLAQQSDDKLRHVLFALCIHCGRLPRQELDESHDQPHDQLHDQPVIDSTPTVRRAA